MKDIFKIVHTETHDVLLKKTWSEEEESPEIEIVLFPIEGLETSITLGFDTEEKRDEIFNIYSVKQAETLIKNIIADVLKDN